MKRVYVLSLTLLVPYLHASDSGSAVAASTPMTPRTAAIASLTQKFEHLSTQLAAQQTQHQQELAQLASKIPAPLSPRVSPAELETKLATLHAHQDHMIRSSSKSCVDKFTQLESQQHATATQLAELQDDLYTQGQDLQQQITTLGLYTVTQEEHQEAITKIGVLQAIQPSSPRASAAQLAELQKVQQEQHGQAMSKFVTLDMTQITYQQNCANVLADLASKHDKLDARVAAPHVAMAVAAALTKLAPPAASKK